MFKNFFIIATLIFLTNCTAPGSAFLGPVFTGVTTKSWAQTSFSYGTNQAIRKIKETSKKSTKEFKNIVKKIDDLNLEKKSEDFYASVKSLYLNKKQQNEKIVFIHR